MRPEQTAIVDYATPPPSRRPWRVAAGRHPAITAAVVAFVLAHLLAVGLFAISGLDFWFFLWSAIRAFSFWTVPFVAVVAASALLLPAGRRPRSLVAAVLLGLVVGVGWTFFVATALGMFFGGFVFPPLYPWVGGAIGGLLAAVGLRSPAAA